VTIEQANEYKLSQATLQDLEPRCEGDDSCNERRNVDIVLLVLRSLLTPSFQLQSVIHSPLIRTNEVLFESEQSRVRGLLQDIETELKPIDIEITRAQGRIFLLQDKRAGYVKDMKKLQPAIAPHKSLPPKILADIPALCCRDC